MRRRRAGSAVVAALGIVALAGALLAATAGRGSAAARTAVLERASVRLEGAARLLLAEQLLAWPAAADSLPVGGFADRAVRLPADVAAGAPMRGTLRIQRLAPALHAITLELRVETGEPAIVVARRRLRLYVRRQIVSPAGDSASAPSAIARWPLVDLP